MTYNVIKNEQIKKRKKLKMSNTYDNSLIELVDEICYYHEINNNINTYKKIVNLMDNVLQLLEPFDIDETEIREEGRMARERGDNEKLVSIRKKLNKKKGILKLSGKEHLGRVDALRSVLFPYEEDKHSEHPNSMEYFVINMEKAGFSSKIIYSKLRDEWEYFKKMNNIN